MCRESGCFAAMIPAVMIVPAVGTMPAVMTEARDTRDTESQFARLAAAAPLCPQLVLYSTADALIPPASVEAYVRAQVCACHPHNTYTSTCLMDVHTIIYMYRSTITAFY